MGTGEENTPSKTKPVPSTQEIPSAPSYPDWSGSLQAYYAPGATPPPFFTSTVASPTPHPYLWGGQSLIPPYGAPVPYPALYPPGGVYGHPNMQPTHMAMLPNIELEGKGQDGKDRSSAKKSKANSGNAGMAGAKAGESGKATSGSGNDGASQSAESGSDGSSDASDDNQQDMSANRKGSFDRMLADASVPGKPVGSMPATNLNIGMDLWNASGASAGSSKLRPNPSATSSSAAAGALGDQWIQQDEREIKRQKRKQSNRESARRSRLRKQAECEELQGRVESLNTENRTLREELLKLSEECEKLNSENTSIKEELTRVCGPEVVANLDLRVQDVDSKS